MHQFAKLVRNPLVVLNGGGTIAHLNTAARALCGDVEHGHEVFTNLQHTRALLEHASGWGDPVPGTLDVRTKAGAVRRWPVYALALRAPEPAQVAPTQVVPTQFASTQFAIELHAGTEDKFAALTERVHELHREIAARQESQAQLEQAVARNEMLYRELQHRVKNNLQMIISLIAIAERENPQVASLAFLQGLKAKLAALVCAQQLMYEESVAEGVPSDRMIEAVAASARSLTRCHVTMALELENALLPNDLAFSLALVANELLTNAAKYGCNDNQGTVRVSFRHAPGEVVLTVADDGPGFIVPPGGRASSGLGLVRGLCRQLGGRLEIASHAGGTTARVFLPLRDAADDAD